MTDYIVQKVVEAIADEKGIDPDEAEFALYDYIDTDAIERLATHETASWTLSFELPNHNVTVTGDGAVFVDSQKKALSV